MFVELALSKRPTKVAFNLNELKCISQDENGMAELRWDVGVPLKTETPYDEVMAAIRTACTTTPTQPPVQPALNVGVNSEYNETSLNGGYRYPLAVRSSVLKYILVQVTTSEKSLVFSLIKQNSTDNKVEKMDVTKINKGLVYDDKGEPVSMGRVRLIIPGIWSVYNSAHSATGRGESLMRSGEPTTMEARLSTKGALFFYNQNKRLSLEYLSKNWVLSWRQPERATFVFMESMFNRLLDGTITHDEIRLCRVK